MSNVKVTSYRFFLVFLIINTLFCKQITDELSDKVVRHASLERRLKYLEIRQKSKANFTVN